MGPEYNAFLYAPIGIDPNGSTISVLSAMARMDLDPWQEAAHLSVLSGKAAMRRLASLIAALPVNPSTTTEPALIAQRLIPLLPGQIAPTAIVQPLRKALLSSGALTPSRTVLIMLVLLIVFALVPLWYRSQGTPPQSVPQRSGMTTTPGK
jgi:hypothetical protein